MNLADTLNFRLRGIRRKEHTVWAKFQTLFCVKFGSFYPTHLHLIRTVFAFEFYHAQPLFLSAKERPSLDYVEVTVTIDAQQTITGLDAGFR